MPDDALSFCTGGTSCHGAAGAKTCLADVIAGATCSTTDGPECASALTCTSGKCVEKALDACK